VAEPELPDADLLRYSRHLLLEDVGVEGQRRILKSRVLIIGAGGLGSPAAMYLACSGVGNITIVDDDTVDLTNLQRQIMHSTERIGQAKVLSAQSTLAQLNPAVQVQALQTRADAKLLQSLVAQADVVLDCCDNFQTRQAINAVCVQHRVPLVSGAAIGMDGQIAVYDPRDPNAPCYACVFAPDTPPEEARCATMGV
jgi:molybdopterin/thiamine biosynthesis adenylyltransferase